MYVIPGCTKLDFCTPAGVLEPSICEYVRFVGKCLDPSDESFLSTMFLFISPIRPKSRMKSTILSLIQCSGCDLKKVVETTSNGSDVRHRGMIFRLSSLDQRIWSWPVSWSYSASMGSLTDSIMAERVRLLPTNGMRTRNESNCWSNSSTVGGDSWSELADWSVPPCDGILKEICPLWFDRSKENCKYSVLLF
ncbi:hypothetical protein OGAPHI_003671 [Ogataea philodendri]|uniref:Uncharacterized protein n=1 Tax=Ogataea philodendri TaxID=1378263 RepID=A0A9P8P5L5_9ASCO|nr:uncharacterized protein OGAPHI_003671 [Ogataea philodendri]KAH3665486.1 hypothetical protein OGAPHI_003671 [Ogataea philodendri]